MRTNFLPNTPFIAIQELNLLTIGPDDYVVYGGTFDPFHEGHLSVINTLTKFFQRIVIAPTAANPWKAEQSTPLPLRVQMIELVLQEENIPIVQTLDKEGVFICDEKYIYAEDLVAFLRSVLQGILYWVVGEDSAKTVTKWRNWEKLGVQVIVAPIVIHVHATEIRATGKGLHPALADFVRKHKLYDITGCTTKKS